MSKEFLKQWRKKHFEFKRVSNKDINKYFDLVAGIKFRKKDGFQVFKSGRFSTLLRREK